MSWINGNWLGPDWRSQEQYAWQPLPTTASSVVSSPVQGSQHSGWIQYAWTPEVVSENNKLVMNSGDVSTCKHFRWDTWRYTSLLRNKEINPTCAKRLCANSNYQVKIKDCDRAMLQVTERSASGVAPQSRKVAVTRFAISAAMLEQKTSKRKLLFEMV